MTGSEESMPEINPNGPQPSIEDRLSVEDFEVRAEEEAGSLGWLLLSSGGED